MIRHAGLLPLTAIAYGININLIPGVLCLAFTVVLLTIAVGSFSIGSLLVFAIRIAVLPPAGFLAATITAVTVAAITAATNVKNRSTAIGNTEALAKDNIGVSSQVPPHPHPVTAGQAGHSRETLFLLRVVDCYPSHRYELRPQPLARLGSSRHY